MNKIEWISVSDILPVDEGDVLVLRNGLNGCDMFVASFEGDYWLINGTNELIPIISVEYWAELPKLPKEEEDYGI